MKNRRIFISIIIIIIASIILPLLSSCAENDTAGEKNNTLKPTIYENTIVIGSDTTYPPFEFIQDTEITGFDIDIIKEIASVLDKEIKIESIKWDSSYNMPEDPEVDLIISAVPIVEGKEEFIDFSDPYFDMEYLLISLTETQIKIKENLYSKKIGVLSASENDFNEEVLGKYEVIFYEDILAMIEDFKNKNVEGILISLPIGVSLLKENSGIFNVIQTVQSNKQFGIVLRKDSILKESINQALQEIKDNGTYENIYNRWFEY